MAATAAEAAAVEAHAAQAHRRLLVWIESREFPIRMLDRLPLRWLTLGIAAPNTTTHRGVALRGEFYVFQVPARTAARRCDADRLLNICLRVSRIPF